jgi:predicted PurR-regulated permease PerM
VPLASCAEQLDLQYAFITAVLTVLLSYLQLVGGDPSSILSALVAVGEEV